MSDSEPEDDVPDELLLVGHVMAHAANEVLLLARLEPNFNPKPANITGTGAEVKALEHRTAKVIEALGGPPRLVIVTDDQPRPRYDTYAQAAISEVILMFHRARSSVCRTHMHFIAGSMIEREPQLLTWPDNPKIAGIMQTLTIKEFWEHAETSFIKLASLWDRLGQLLDFVFFNIRQYEDGFPAVMDRIAANYLPVYEELRLSKSWQAIRKFQTSERADGLKWLLRRRNLLVHSLHLRPVDNADDAEDPIFESAYNHLDNSAKKRLAPGNREEELNHLHVHLTAAATLLNEVLNLCEIGAKLRIQLDREV